MARAARADEMEKAILERGEALLARVRPRRLVTLTPSWWQERALEWASNAPEFRTKLLRFVDVLPALRTTAAVADHVRQYFREDAPVAVRLSSALAGPGAFRPVLSKAVRGGVFAMGDRFIAGATPREALARLQALAEEGVGYTVDLLGEATLSDREADSYAARYMDLIATLGAASSGWQGPERARRPNVSLKLSALAPHFEPAARDAVWGAIRGRLVPVLAAARDGGAFVNIDMEQYRYRDLTHGLFARAAMEPGLRAWSGLGIVVQAYLKDALDSLDELGALARERGTPITVRLVKGAYWDEEVVVARQESHPVPVFQAKDATDAHFEQCSARLLEHYPHLRPAFATHNPRSIAQAMVRAGRAGIPQADVEFQMLFGMAEGIREAVAAEGYLTRVYAPIGELIPGMAYLVRRLLENTSNESWLVHRHEEADPGEALRVPDSGDVEVADPGGFRNHPPAEFHLPEPRAAMEAALTGVRDRFPFEVPMLIAGVPQTAGETMEVRPPAKPSTVMATAAVAGAEDAGRAVESVRRGFLRWRGVPAEERAAILCRAADLLDERRHELAAIMCYESAKPWREADGDVVEAIDFLRYYAAEGERLARPRDLSLVPGETNVLRYEGIGVVAVIAPWNFPLAILTGTTSAALAAGCAVVVKPAEESPVIAGRLVDILLEAGVPADVIAFVPGRGEEAGVALVEHPDVDMVAFTGSNAVGREIVRRAAASGTRAEGIKRVVAELGGKNALIIDEDADLDEAVAGTIASAFGFAGQKCSACSRAIVVGSAYGEFRERLAAAVESLPVGPPDNPYTLVPPVISAEARERIERYITLAQEEGILVARAQAPEGEGHYVAPHVFAGLPEDSRVLREEIFGPVLALAHGEDFGEALEMALDSDFALTGGVYSRNPRNIAAAAAAFRVGNLYINRQITGSMVGRQPFAGLAASGTGDKAGPDYVRRFMVARAVTENMMRRGFAPGSDGGGR